MKIISRTKPLFSILLLILLLSLIIRLLYVLLNYPLWWDSHIYVSIGKYIFSSGELGIWETFRPLIHPFILGLFWNLKLNPFIVGKFLDIVFSTVAVYLTYLIGKNVFDKKTGLVAAFVFSLTPIFLMIAGLILSDPLALTFGLGGIYLLTKNSGMKNADKKNHLNKNLPAALNIFLGGLLLALGFLTRFPMGIWFGAAFLIFIFSALTCKKKELSGRLKKTLLITSGFLIPVIPYFLFNYARYGNPFTPLISGSEIVTTATWLYGKGISFYFFEFFLANPIYLLFFFGIYLLFRKRLWTNTDKLILYLIPVLAIIYFIYVPRKEVRYILTALPLLSLIVAYTVTHIHRFLKSQKKPYVNPKSFIAICLIFILIPIPNTFEIGRMPTFNHEIKEIVESRNIAGTVIASDPAFVSFLDQRIVTLDGMEFAWKKYVEERDKKEYGLIFMNDCDLICAPADERCELEKRTLLENIEEQNEQIFRKTYIITTIKQTCTYSMYVPKND